MYMKRLTGKRRCYICNSNQTYVTPQGYEVWHSPEDPRLKNKGLYRCGKCYSREQMRGYWDKKRVEENFNEISQSKELVEIMGRHMIENPEPKECVECGSTKTFSSRTNRLGCWYHNITDYSKRNPDDYKEGYICSKCYSRKTYNATKFMRGKTRIPDIFRHWVKMIEYFEKKEARELKAEYCSEHMCNEIACLQQRRLVKKEHPHTSYAEKFEWYNRCNGCRTFWPKGSLYCPCCKTKGGRLKTKISRAVLRKNKIRYKIKRAERWNRMAETTVNSFFNLIEVTVK